VEEEPDMLLFRGISLSAGAVVLTLLTGCSSGNIAGPTVGGAIAPATIGSGTASRLSALRRLLLPGIPTSGGGVAVHPFIDFAAMAKNKGPTIAISDIDNGVVDLFTAAGTQVAQLTGFRGPHGMASDIKGDLYVADSYNSRVQIYAAGFASPPTTLSDPGQIPSDVDSFANGAYVAVTNFVTTSSGPGSVSIFKGSTLQNNITSSNLRYAEYCAFDGKGNLYLDGLDPSGYGILGEIPNATSGGSTFEQLATANFIGFPAGIQVTTAGGRIAIEDADSLAIYTYNPPSGGSLGAPTRMTPLGGSSFPLSFAFTKDMTNLYLADGGNAQDAAEYAYPTGGKAVSTITVGGAPYGTAVIPTQYPSISR
jgi:hypothetical protein